MKYQSLLDSLETMFPASCNIITFTSGENRPLSLTEIDYIRDTLAVGGDKIPLTHGWLSTLAGMATNDITHIAKDGVAVMNVIGLDEPGMAKGYYRRLKAAFGAPRLGILLDTTGSSELRNVTDIQLTPQLDTPGYFRLTNNPWGRTGQDVYLGPDANGQLVIEPHS